MFSLFLFAFAIVFANGQLCAEDPECLKSPDRSLMNGIMKLKEMQWEECSEKKECPDLTVQNTLADKCVNGKAGEYPCCGVDLLSFINIATLGASGDGNDVWGWTDPVTGKEYAIMGLYDGTSFVDVSNPFAPSVVGFMKTQTSSSSWRDIKVYKDHAFIVSEAANHGMQIYDLKGLRSLEVRPFVLANGTFNLAPPPALKPNVVYTQFGSTHNLVINEETGFAYAVGTKTCSGGLHMVDIRNPLNPIYAGCFAADGYTHDAQCVIYRGPDAPYVGKEICFCYNEDTLTIVDVSVKASPVMIARKSYSGVQYTHQGWLLSDWSHLLLNDELDELNGASGKTRTLLWDVSKLTNPVFKAAYLAKDNSIDHNLYVIGNTAYLANYCDGLRVLDTTLAAAGTLSQKAFFKVSPTCTTLKFLGSWSNYPYFSSGTILVSSIERGLFVLKLNGDKC